MTQLTTTQAMAKLNLDAKVTLDDLVNIVVSRHEEELYQARKSVQQHIQALMVNQKNVGTRIREVALDAVKDMFHPMATIHTSGLAVKVQVTAAETMDLDKVDYWTISFEQTIVLPDNQMQFAKKNYTYEQDAGNTFTSTIKYQIDIGLMQEWRLISVQMEEQRQKLHALNAELQAVDRKTRQVKAHLAQQKLQAEGMEELLQAPEITRILQIGN